MFGKNEVVGQAYFSPLAHPGELLVANLFYTIQGEGPTGGEPAIFLRLAKCNLQCSFCDTWFDSGVWAHGADIIEQAEVLLKARRPKGTLQEVGLVITGGEPMLQRELPGFLKTYRKRFSWMQIESNGLLSMKDLPEHVMKVVSPKCTEGSNAHYLNIHKDNLTVYGVDALKFLVSADPDSPYHEIPEWARDWKKALGRPLYISPMNCYARKPAPEGEISSFWTPGLLDHKANQANHEYAARLCIQEGYQLSLQMHLYTSVA